jgi:thioredoxin 1
VTSRIEPSILALDVPGGGTGRDAGGTGSMLPGRALTRAAGCTNSRNVGKDLYMHKGYWTGSTRDHDPESGAPGPALSRILLLLLVLVVAGGAPIAARAGDPLLSLAVAAPEGAAGWDETLGLQAVLDDSVDAAARIFDSPDYQQQLLVPAGGDQVYLLGLKDQSVRLLPRNSVAWVADEEALPDPAKAQPGGRLTKISGEIAFDVADRRWTIRPEPPMVGLISMETLRKSKPDYLRLAAKYTPDPGAVKAISTAKDTKVVVFFGSWCHVCKKWVPHFLKTLEAAKNPGLTVDLYGVTEDHLEPNDPIIKYGITTTPTFIVMRGGKEIGRITENPDVSVEKDLALIMAAK